MTTRAQIQTDIQNTLNRNQAVLVAMISTWFENAHRKVQKRLTFPFMEHTETTLVLANGVDSYALPVGLANVKNWLLIYAWDSVAGRLVRYFDITDMAIIRQRRVDVDPLSDESQDWSGYDTFLAAPWGTNLEIWPKPAGDNGLVGKQLRADVVRIVDPPASADSDFLTDNARDYLLYESLCESAPWLENDKRLPLWTAAALQRYNDLVPLSIEPRLGSGSLVMRG